MKDIADGGARPIFIYVSTEDEKMEQKIETYENSILTNEKLNIALKFFDTYRVYVEDLEENQSIKALLKNPKPLTFHTLYNGKIVSRTKDKPSAPKLISMCSKTFSNIYSGSFNKYMKQELKILDNLDKVKAKLQKVKDKLDLHCDKLSDKEIESLEKQLLELEQEEEKYEAEQKKLFDSPVIKKKKK